MYRKNKAKSYIMLPVQDAHGTENVRTMDGQDGYKDWIKDDRTSARDE